jgi:FtsP/CotA-like multicopper oxidase with cupredoxin domain
VAINDNRRPAGTLRDGVLTLRIDARPGSWHPDGDDAGGAVVPAFAEEGRAPSIPGPLVRVPAGTEVALTMRNSLALPLTLGGVSSRAASTSARSADQVIVLAPAESRTVRFRLEVPGTYYYWGSTMGRAVDWRVGEDAQLSGAIVVDAAGAPSARDRILMIGVWADTVGRAFAHRKRILAVVNGRSWPHTERFTFDVGDTVRWRVINSSADSHPMHLHGFYYMVDSRGDGSGDTTYAPTDRRRVNTELLMPGTTMSLAWVPERPGNWLFHCHLPDHFGARGPLGIERGASAEGAHGNGHRTTNHALEEMNGLVVGVTVRGSTTDVAMQGGGVSRRQLRLLVRPSVGGTARQPLYAFALQGDGGEPPPDTGLRVGPTLVVTRNEPVSITVVNTLGVPTAVHWHGIELESYFDGVAGFSGAGRRLSPVIAPHDSFVARFTPPRAGTFIYHTHVDETRQQLAGLAGPLVVVEPGRPFDPAVDHTILISTPPDSAAELREVLVNGSPAPAPLWMSAGVTQRLRFINMTTRRPGMRVELWRDSALARWRPIAKDGAELPAARQLSRPARTPITIGETMDFEITPAAEDGMRLEFRGVDGARLATLPVRVRREP